MSSTARMSWPSCRNVLRRLSVRITGVRGLVDRLERGLLRRGPRQLVRLLPEVAAAVAPAAEVVERRLVLRADLLGEAAAVDEHAGRQVGPELRQEARDGVQPLLVLADAAARQAAQQADRVGMARVVEDVVDGALLDEAAGVEHAHAVAHLGDHVEVVADEEDARAELLAQLRDEVEHLGLHRGVQPGRRLVEDQQRRVLGQRHGDDHALRHAARELVRVTAHHAVGIGDLHLGEDLPRAVVAPAWDPRRRSCTPRPPGRRP